MQKAANVWLWLAKYAGGGLVSYAAPRLAVGAGIPLDTWFIAMGGWFALSISKEVALNTVSALIGAALLAISHWGTRAGRQAIANRARAWAAELASWRVRVERVGNPASPPAPTMAPSKGGIVRGSLPASLPKDPPKATKRESTKLTGRELLLFYEGRTALQANKLIEDHVGLWTTAHGQVDSIQPEGATTILMLRYGVYAFKCRFMSDDWAKALGRISPGEQLSVVGEVHCYQNGVELYLFNCELAPETAAKPKVDFTVVGEWLNTPFRFDSLGADERGRTTYCEDACITLTANDFLESVRVEITVSQGQSRQHKYWHKGVFEGTVTPGMLEPIRFFRRTFRLINVPVGNVDREGYTNRHIRHEGQIILFDGTPAEVKGFPHGLTQIEVCVHHRGGKECVNVTVDSDRIHAPRSRLIANDPVKVKIGNNYSRPFGAAMLYEEDPP